LDPSIYLHWLQSNCLEQGVSFQRRTLSHIREAFLSEEVLPPRPDIVINCSGILASILGGVDDDKVVPMRGQLVVVANESKGMWFLSGADDLDKSIGECCYIIDRPAGTFLSNNAMQFQEKLTMD